MTVSTLRAFDLSFDLVDCYSNQLIESTTALVVGLDRRARIRVFNPAAERVTGYTRDEVIGRNWFEIFGPRSDHAHLWTQFSEPLSNSPLPTVSEKLMTKPGEKRFISWRHSDVPDREDPVGTLSFGFDITDARKVEQDLQRERTLLARITETSPSGIMALDPTGRITIANSQAAQLLGLTKEQIIGRAYNPDAGQVHMVGLDGEPFPEAELPFHRVIASGAPVYDVQHGILRPDGTRVIVSVSAAPLRDEFHQHIVGVVATLNDVTRQVSLNRELDQRLRDLAAAHERVQVLSRRMVDLQETERRGIARELHDEVGQVLTSLKVVLEMGMRSADGTTRPYLVEAQQLTAELLSQVHELSLDLRPSMLDDFGLLPTLLWHCERFGARAGIQVSLQHSGMEYRRFPAEVETAAYRIAQESLTNIARHAGVDQATMRIWISADTLQLQVEDAGAGFDPVAALGSFSSSGLLGMQERAELVGGRVTLDSAPGYGTRVTAEFPCAPSASVYDHRRERQA